jgi:DNA-binding NarL/FixJ family response regulator
MAEADAIRVVIAEDSAILRDGLHQLLTDRGFAVIRAVADAVTLEQAIADDPPDVAVVDIRMPPTFTDEGLRTAIRLRQDHPDVGILVFSQYIETRSPTWPTSPRRWCGWPRAAPHSTRRW